MNKDESPIDSFSVSLGPSSSESPGLSGRHRQPWNILICSDLGFKSVHSREIRIAEWNEFMASEHITVSGTIENMLSPFQGPIFVEHAVSAMKDFSPLVLKSRIKAFSGYAGLLDSLTGLIQGKTGRQKILSALQKASLPSPEQERVLALFGLHNPPLEKPPAPSPNASTVASILSMVDISNSTPEEKHEPDKVMEGLLNAVSGNQHPIDNKTACIAYIESGNRMLNKQLAVLQAAPFFAFKKASWQCLMQCAKAIGRKKEIRLSVFSASMDDRDEIPDMLTAEYGSSDASPDIIIWDFPVSFTNSEIELLTRLAEVADRFKSMVIAPLSPNDRLFEHIEARSDFAPVFQDIRFLPYKKFRSMLASRAVCLCAPMIMIPDIGDTEDSPPIAFPAHCCWPMLMRWIEMTLEKGDPFAVDSSGETTESPLLENASFHTFIPDTVSEQAAAVAGLTLYKGEPFDATVSRARTVVEPEVAGTAYTSFAFNLLVNRVARLVGRRIVQGDASKVENEIPGDINEFLCNELIACRICNTMDQVSVKSEKDGALDVALNSDVAVGGHPARFSFSLDV